MLVFDLYTLINNELQKIYNSKFKISCLNIFLNFLEIDLEVLKDQYFKDHLIYKVDNYKTIQNLSYE